MGIYKGTGYFDMEPVDETQWENAPKPTGNDLERYSKQNHWCSEGHLAADAEFQHSKYGRAYPICRMHLAMKRKANLDARGLGLTGLPKAIEVAGYERKGAYGTHVKPHDRHIQTTLPTPPAPRVKSHERTARPMGRPSNAERERRAQAIADEQARRIAELTAQAEQEEADAQADEIQRLSEEYQAIIETPAPEEFEPVTEREHMQALADAGVELNPLTATTLGVSAAVELDTGAPALVETPPEMVRELARMRVDVMSLRDWLKLEFTHSAMLCGADLFVRNGTASVWVLRPDGSEVTEAVSIPVLRAIAGPREGIVFY